MRSPPASLATLCLHWRGFYDARRKETVNLPYPIELERNPRLFYQPEELTKLNAEPNEEGEDRRADEKAYDLMTQTAL